jgi:tetratricopeptide (TPR) repeat protein
MIMKKNLLTERTRFDIIYAFVLFIPLLIIYFPCFSIPPRSDYWQMFYFFHHLDELPGQVKWLHVLNYDVFEQMRYQPLSRLYYYFLHLLPGANFFLFNLSNFILYFFTAFLLYKFSLNFSKRRIIAAVFIGLFSLLFSHSDIVLWSYHIYIIAGLCMFLLGFMCFIKFLKIGSWALLFLVILFLLSGMLFYESFFLWPLAIIILSSIKHLRAGQGPNIKKLFKSICLVLLTVYILYISFYFFTRSINTYGRPLHQISDYIKLANFASCGLSSLFSVLYNNIILNIYPLLSFPLRVAENIELDGPIMSLVEKWRLLIAFGGTLLGISLIGLFLYLRRKKYFEEIKIISFFLFLLLSENCVLFFCRMITNGFQYSLMQFRYLYISNAIFILIIIFLVEKLFALSKTKQNLLFSIIVTLVLFLNIYCIQKVKNIYEYQFADLKKMLLNIKSGIHEGHIDKNHKLYLGRDITDYFPILCWNIEMGERFIKGNYQWLFSRKEIEYFSENPEDASWVIKRNDFSLGKNSVENLLKKGIKVNSVKNKDYDDLGKDSKYLELSYFLLAKGNHKEAEAMFKKALEFNPRNGGAYAGLGNCYNELQRYQEAEECFKKALELNPNNGGAYAGLGNFYNSQGRYQEAEPMFRKALELNPKNGGFYTELGYCYIELQRYQEAEECFKKALELNPNNGGAYNGLGNLYNSQQRYQEVETIFKRALELSPNNGGAWTGLGNFYNEQQRYSEAEKMFKRALELNPRNDGAWTGLGNFYISQRKYVDAEEMFKKALQINSRNEGTYTSFGHFYNSQGRCQEAEVMFKKAIELNPRSEGAYNGLGYCYVELQRQPEAEVMFKKAIELNPRSEGAYNGLGNLYNSQKRYTEAEEIFKRIKK